MAVDVQVRDGLAVIRVDDGRVNALTPDLVRAIDRVLDEALGVLICGRPGFLSAGFDLHVMRGDPARRGELVTAGRALLLRLFDHRGPVVIACTGHAIAAGAGLLVAADWRVGAHGPFRLGFNEVAIGHSLTAATLEMIRYRMLPTAFESVVRGETFDPEQALTAGLLDELAEPDEVAAVAEEAARRMAALDPEAYATVKRRARQPALDAARRAVAEETAPP